MLDQSFTADNFRKIFDYENRKGVYLEGEFFPEVEKITKELKKCATAFRELKKKKDGLPEEDYENQKKILSEKREELREKKEKLLTEELEKVSSEITDGSFIIKLKEADIGSAKKAYTTEKSASSYFAFKQIQYNIRKLYKVKQGNRYNIICQLRELLSDSFPKYIIRTDIQEFFESIPRERLEKKITDEPLLTLSSKKIIRQTLKEYTRISGNANGVPRGIGISSYLSELYMRQLDEQIRTQPDVIFYARYVDDIVVIYAPKPNSDKSVLESNLKAIISKAGLAVNLEKTKALDLTSSSNSSLEYLGYNMSFGSGKVTIKLSNKKIDKYKTRISSSFSAYTKEARFNEQKARKILIKRIRFLTGNTRLLNNKRHAVVGIYFSNSLLNCSSTLAGLDAFLQNQIHQIPSETLKNRLNQMSFVEGFTQRRFSHFSTAELAKIVRAWKHVA